jgi:O-acetyl-ADP-ribose deacetylase (regulator of RNase III)
MSSERVLGKTTVKVVKGDVTALESDAMVFYAQPSLLLGSGFGNAIAQRGGPKIQEEAKKLAPVETTAAVVTTGGNLPVKHIIHAVGPRFQEAELEQKLRATVINVLARVEEKQLRRLTLPPLGAGFYGVPLPLCAKVTLGVLKEHLARPSSLDEVVICCSDTRQVQPFTSTLATL